MNQKFKKTVFFLYLSFFVNGVVAILITQIAVKLTGQIGVTYDAIIAATAVRGTVRIITFPVFGYLSDKIGRKFFQILGLGSLVPMLLLIIFADNLTMLTIAIVFLGISNSSLDLGTYPTLVEVSTGDNKNTMSVLAKAFMSIAQFIFPLLVGLFFAKGIHYSGLLYIVLALIIITIIGVLVSPFPAVRSSKAKEKTEDVELVDANGKKPSMLADGVPMIILGFFILAAFCIVPSYLPKMGMELAGCSEGGAQVFSSIFAIATLAGVFLNSYIVKRWMRATKMFYINMILTTLGSAAAFIWPSYTTIVIMSVTMGLFAAGGLYQLQLAVMLQLFPKQKGTLTGVNSVVSSVALMAVPIISAWAAGIELKNVIIFNMVITILGALLGFYMDIRMKKFKEAPK